MYISLCTRPVPALGVPAQPPAAPGTFSTAAPPALSRASSLSNLRGHTTRTSEYSTAIVDGDRSRSKRTDSLRAAEVSLEMPAESEQAVLAGVYRLMSPDNRSHSLPVWQQTAVEEGYIPGYLENRLSMKRDEKQRKHKEKRRYLFQNSEHQWVFTSQGEPAVADGQGEVYSKARRGGRRQRHDRI